MLKLSSTLLNQPIMSLRTGGQIGLAQTPIINPHNLKIMGWWCKGDSSQRQILLSEEVRESLPNGLAVNDDDALSETNDLVRHKEILEINFDLIEKQVRTKRQKLGKVSDYSYNEEMFIQKLYVARPIHKVFTSEDTLIIDREQILEVTDKFILVRDTDIRATADELAGSAATA